MFVLSRHLQYSKPLSLLLILFLASCTQFSTSPPAAPIPSKTSTMTIATTKKPTNTSAPTLTPTWTPVAKLSAEDAWARFLTLYENTSNCELPCWWNIIPGETLWEDVNNQLGPLGTIVLSNKSSSMVSYNFLYDLPQKADSLPEQLVAGFIVEDDTVQAISVNTQWVNRNFDYSLAGLLNHLGEPTEIWLRLFPESASGIPHYEMQLFFLNQGVWIWLVGDATIEDEVMTICPQDRLESPRPRGLFLWNLEQARSSSDVDKKFDFFWAEGMKLEHYRLLEDLQSDINTKGFYENYINPQVTKCFHVNAHDFYNP